MNILITGYKGFIGQNFVEALGARHTLTLFEWGESLPNLKKIDWVIHLGAITSTIERDVYRILEQNYDFSCWLFDQCALYDVNLQYASSASVYGNKSNFRETDMPNPQSAYAWSKLWFEHYVTNKIKKYPNIIAQGFRYFNVYGSYEHHKGNQASPYHKFLHQAVNNGEIVLFENSDQYYRDFVPVEHIIDIQSRFLNIKQSGIWNIGTGQPKSFQSIADYIATRTGASIKYIPMPTELKSQYQDYTCADITKLTTTLNEENCN